MPTLALTLAHPHPRSRSPSLTLTLTLTPDDLSLVVDVLDSHVYWQLSDRAYRSSVLRTAVRHDGAGAAKS